MENTPMEIVVEKRNRAYKWKFIMMRNIAIGLMLLLLMTMVLLAWALKGNKSLNPNVTTIEVRK